jgi:hypothetical protein
MTNLRRIINKLQNIQNQQVKVDAQIFAVAAEATQLNEDLLACVEEKQQNLLALLPKKPITQAYCLERFGSYNATYKAYKEYYGISCKVGWKYLLPLVQDLEPPNFNRELPQSIVEKVKELIVAGNITEDKLLDFANFIVSEASNHSGYHS